MKALGMQLWRIIRDDRLASFGLVVITLFVLVAVLAPFVATHDPEAINYRTEGTAVWYRDGRWVVQANIAAHTLNAVAVYEDGRVIAVGNAGTVLLYNGASWDTIDAPTEADLHAVAVWEDTAHIVGAQGVALRLEGTAPELVATGVEADLRAVDLAAADAGLAVGQGGVVLRWKGTRWTLFDEVPEELHDVSLANPSFGLLVGARSTVYRYDGEQLQRENILGFRDLAGVHAWDDTAAIAVGLRGTILTFDGQSWRTMFSPETRNLRAVQMLDEDRALVIGAHGVVLLLQDGTWHREDSGYRRHLRDIGASGGQVLAVGTDPYVNELAPPSREHLFGTTHLGRDIFSQVVFGTRIALLIGLLAAFMVTFVGTNVGLVAGYFGGRTGNLLMRVVDVFYALPLEPFAIVLVMVFRPSIMIIILAIGVLTWRTTARVIRSQVLSLAARPFVKAAKVAGAGHLRIMFVHIAPNVLPLVFLQLAVSMAFAITAEATLSFLGLGPPRTYSWGTILHAARLSGAWRTAWWWVIPPGLAIMLAVVSVFFISRALEVLTNPRLAKGVRRAP